MIKSCKKKNTRTGKKNHHQKPLNVSEARANRSTQAKSTPVFITSDMLPPFRPNLTPFRSTNPDFLLIIIAGFTVSPGEYFYHTLRKKVNAL
jgi:hypothetical protein